MENELEKALENKFFCPSRFAQEIETLVHENGNLNYIDSNVRVTGGTTGYSISIPIRFIKKV